MKLNQFLYMSEAEGVDNWVDTKKAKINAAINEFVDLHRRGYDINNYIYEVLNHHGLSEDLLTDAECNRIMREVEKRCNR